MSILNIPSGIINKSKIRKIANNKRIKFTKKNCNENLEKYLDISNQLNVAINTAFEEYKAKTENEIKSYPKNFFNSVKN